MDTVYIICRFLFDCVNHSITNCCWPALRARYAWISDVGPPAVRRLSCGPVLVARSSVVNKLQPALLSTNGDGRSRTMFTTCCVTQKLITKHDCQPAYLLQSAYSCCTVCCLILFQERRPNIVNMTTVVMRESVDDAYIDEICYIIGKSTHTGIKGVHLSQYVFY